MISNYFFNNQEISTSPGEEELQFQQLSDSNCHLRIIESINALIHRFELYLPLSVPKF